MASCGDDDDVDVDGAGVDDAVCCCLTLISIWRVGQRAGPFLAGCSSQPASWPSCCSLDRCMRASRSGGSCGDLPT